MDKEENLLKSIGLTDYESRAYITLLKLGIATAEQISEIGNIPLPRVYDTIAELSKKGFVLISKGRPKKFKAIVPEKALVNLIETRKNIFENEMRQFKSNVKSITKDLLEIQHINLSENKYEIWSTEKRKNLQRTLDEKEGQTKKELLVFSGDLSWFPERIKNIKAIIKKGVKIKVLMKEPTTETASNNMKKAKDIGIFLKTGYEGDLRGDVIDSKLALIAIKTPMETEGEPGTDYKHNYELLIFENPVIVGALKENFEFWWNKLD